MPKRTQVSRRLLATLALTFAATALSGCGKFFVDETGSGTGTGTGGGTGGGTSTGSYAFVVNSVGNESGTVTGYSISSTGQLSTLNGSPITFTVTTPSTATVSRDNKYLWVGTDTRVFGFALSSSGAITALNSGNALVNANQAIDMDTTPDGKWLMVLDNVGNIELFGINSDGTLSPNSGVAFGAVTNQQVTARAMRVSPTGNLVMAALGPAGEIAFNFNSSTGEFDGGAQLVPPGTSSDNGIAFDSTGAYLYVARSGTNQGLVVYNVSSNGTLTATTSSAYTAGSAPWAVALDKAGKNVYVANRNDGTLSAFNIGANAALTAVTGAVSAGTQVQSIGVDSTGKYLLAASYGGSPDLSVYSFDATTQGKLDAVTTTSTGTKPNALALSH